MPELTCISCPLGCELDVQKVDGKWRVKGNLCPRGEAFGIEEMTAPKRVLTTVVSIAGTDTVYLPVISAAAIPKADLRPALDLLRDIEVALPVEAEEVIVSDILGTGVDILAAKTLLSLPEKKNVALSNCCKK